MNEFDEFHNKLVALVESAPAVASRWAYDVLEMFENQFEEQIYPEDHE